MKLNIKKIRFIILSLTLIGATYILSLKLASSQGPGSNLVLLKFVVFISLLTILSSLFTQYLEGGDRGVQVMLYVGIAPLLLTMGCFLFFAYFPNLSVILKIIAGLFYFVLLYTLLLLNNVLLVVESREVHIPVYRVAINWVQIVLLSCAISLFTGLLKIQVQPLVQLLMIVVISFFCFNYLLWVYSNEKDIRQVKPYEGLVLSGVFTLLVGWGAFMSLFFPAESFLRGIFISSVFLLGLGYIQLYLKNSLSKKNIWDYLLICLVFLVILVVFRP